MKLYGNKKKEICILSLKNISGNGTGNDNGNTGGF